MSPASTDSECFGDKSVVLSKFSVLLRREVSETGDISLHVIARSARDVTFVDNFPATWRGAGAGRVGVEVWEAPFARAASG